MTLIVGILCTDGVVMAADGAATLGYLGKSTIRQKHKKLKIIGNNAVLGVSGPVGLGQRFYSSISQNWGSIKSLKQPEKVMTEIRLLLWKEIESEIQIARFMVQTLQQGGPFSSAITGSILGCSLAGKPYIFSFNEQGAPEMLPEDLMFVSIGSGQDIADTFLAFLKELFWKTSKPNLNEGVFAALWTLKHAIETNPGGVDYPIQIITISDRSGVWEAREWREEEYQEQEQHIDEIKRMLREYRSSFINSKSALKPPDVPT
ncbi:hypothetical protein J7M00_06400 [bacterium]|nr:hypothetical protein [bacterium]